MRSKIFLGLSIFFLLFLVVAAGKAFAQESNITGSDATTDWKEEFRSDKQDIQAQKQDIKLDSEQAKAEERSLLQQIEEARNAGNFEKAKELRGQLNALHQQNMGEKHEDMEALKESRQEMKGDIKEARKEGELPPPPGNNPPGYNPPGAGPGNPPGYNPPGVGPVNPPGYNPPGSGPGNPPGYNPPGKGKGNPPGYNPLGAGPGNPPGYNPPGVGPVGGGVPPAPKKKAK